METEPPHVRARAASVWLVLGCLAGLAVPLLVALMALRRPVWTPVLDLAMTELRVRDVGGRHTPLIGLPGRIGTLQEQGSHPGPLSFYALAPAYRLLGASSWALQVGTVAVHAAAMGVVLWIASRRGGAWLVVAVAAVLALLTAGYGGGALTEPWNPYLPLLWWVVVLLAAWSVLCGDLPMLPVVVLAASFCAQTHVPYLALGVGLGALCVLGVVWRLRAHPDDRRRALRWAGAAAALGVLLWLPPTIDQARHDPGNYRQLIEHFTEPSEATQGLGVGIREGLGYLDVAFLVVSDVEEPGSLVTSDGGDAPSAWRGAVLLVVWAASAAVAVRRRCQRELVALHVLVGAAIVLMAWSISRIFGEVWYYLGLWGWAIGCLALVATLWTAVAVGTDRWDDGRRARDGRWAIGAVAVLTVALGVRFAIAAPDSTHGDPTVVAELAAIIDDVEAGVRAGAGEASGPDGRYLITWSDAYHIGSQGFGLVNELDRRGIDVGVPPSKRVPATPHRVLAQADATARIHLATGSFVDRYAELPGAVEIAHADPRTRAERAEQAALRASVSDDLRAMGLDELVPKLDDNLFGAAIDLRLPDELRERMGRMLEIGVPIAVYVLPVDAPEL
jgi:hypothetical protein